jgi:hypothetical protein
VTTPEFSRPFDLRQVEGKHVDLVASDAECAGLARWFALVRIDRLAAELSLARTEDGAEGRGRLEAAIVQTCAISGEDLAVAIDEPLYFRFVPRSDVDDPEEEIELGADDCDEIEYDGSIIDCGEAVAQSLALAIDPFATGPGAEEARRRAGIVGEGQAGPFAALAALRGK